MTKRVRLYVREAAVRFGVRSSEILSETRGTPTAAMARQAVMRRLREDGFSSLQIGRWLNRDPSTVLHGARRGIL